MLKYCVFAIFLFFVLRTEAQITPAKNDSTRIKEDSIRKSVFIKQLGNGYFPTKYLNLDLRYLVKYNQFEGLRSGLGFVTNNTFSKRYKVNSYIVYGFRDHRYKYGVGGGFRVIPKTSTWINLYYANDLQESGSSVFLTDKRFFQFFEPRLLNISLFHKYITKSISVEHQISPHLLTEIQFAKTNINPTYDYNYILHNKVFNEFKLSTTILALQWSPFSKFELQDNSIKEVKNGYPKFTLQYTKSYKGVIDSDLNFSKLDFRTIHQINHKNKALSSITLRAGIARGDTPLTHLYHAYPNNITKETISQRFSVAGLSSFETMYFNEFFSDKFTTIQVKHFFNPFNITERYHPQLVVISRFAIGSMNNTNRHQNISFNTLEKGFTESGFEINKLLFGFGLSFTYRYGAYHLPIFEDNIAVKFTFNVTL